MKLTRVAVTAMFLAAAFGPLAPPAMAGGKTRITHNCKGTKVRPAKIIFACGDGNYYVTDLQWTSWGRRSAEARGTFHRNNCHPSCAEGTFQEQTGTLTVKRRRACPDEDGVSVFRRAHVVYDSPLQGSSEEAFKLFCPLS